MSDLDAEDFEDVAAAMQDLQVRIDKVSELSPDACEGHLDDAYLQVNYALNTYRDLEEVTEADG